ncbi:SRPBCC family protein [Devosia nitrariae]|uniref:ATPase n=1 Tax=Devosia nitrariae TaxID=2071872 RepID=A0ABQ5W1C3_9HYPH|nr:SRPBCC family protein [Devosia nitrariae]GLQ53513.1 ATPase [Devosia nitrariae]
MNRTVTIAPVRKTITVAATPEHAFRFFTQSMSRWWNKGYTIGKSPQKDVVVEPRAGGRWFERGENGSECQWGKVLTWDPPNRVVLAWQITPQWTYDEEILTELDVRFLDEGGKTRVELEHRLDAYGAAAEQMRELFDGPGGWMGLLEAYAGSLS